MGDAFRDGLGCEDVRMSSIPFERSADAPPLPHSRRRKAALDSDGDEPNPSTPRRAPYATAAAPQASPSPAPRVVGTPRPSPAPVNLSRPHGSPAPSLFFTPRATPSVFKNAAHSTPKQHQNQGHSTAPSSPAQGSEWNAENLSPVTISLILEPLEPSPSPQRTALPASIAPMQHAEAILLEWGRLDLILNLNQIYGSGEDHWEASLTSLNLDPGLIRDILNAWSQ
jgi:hypothetical protein